MKIKSPVVMLQRVLVLGLLASVLGACTFSTPPIRHGSGFYSPMDNEPRKTESDSTVRPVSHLILASYDAVDKVLKAIETSRLNFRLNKNKPILVSSFVDIDDVRYSSTFGRIIGEQVGSRFAQSGYKVIEVKMRDHLFIPHPDNKDDVSQGEFMLSRELRHLSFEQDAQAVIIGTYASAKDIVYVTLKVVDVRNDTIVYSTDYSLPLDDNIKKMLRDNKRRKRRL